LEELAYEFYSVGPIFLQVALVASYLAGFVVALIIRRNATWSIRRVPYLLLWTCCVLLSTALSFAWLLISYAKADGLLWLLTISIFAGTIAIGYAYGVFAHARSVNAAGTGNFAWIAALPILGLGLVFIAPQQKTVRHGAKWVGDLFGIAVALILLLGAIPTLGWLSDSALEFMARRVAVVP